MNILLIMPNFFSYPKAIVREIERLGHQVDFYDDRPSKSALMKAAIRLNKQFAKPWILHYEKWLLDQTKKKEYDKVLVVSGQSFCFSQSFMKRLRGQQETAEFILYQWDSEENFSYIATMHRFFDRLFSFDPLDCQKNVEMQFLPLFFSEDYERINKIARSESIHDILFVGTAHPSKFTFIKQIANAVKPLLSRQNIYFYLPSKLLFYFRRLTATEFKHAKFTDFHYTALSTNEILDSIRTSWCVIDSPQSNQRGLTMRTLETMGAKRKMITSNKNIIHYDFYNPNNIYVFDGEVDLKDPFFSTEYSDVPNHIYQKYSLKNWVNTLLVLDK